MDLSNIRKTLHQHPELSGEEHNTKKYIQSILEELHADEIIEIGNTGIAAVFKGKSKGDTILIRCELDALPINETNNIPHASKTNGIGHLCGHDGHMTILTGVAEHLSENRPETGRVVLLYQPAEETGQGARRIISDPKFAHLKPDYAIALHNVPGYKKGAIVCKEGIFTPAVISMIVKYTGKTSHAAEPQNGHNPSVAIAKLIEFAVSKTNVSAKEEDFAVITPIFTHIGEKAYGTSAGEGETHFTIRTYSNQKLSTIISSLKTFSEKLAKDYELAASFDFVEEFVANENEELIVKLIEETAKELNFEYVQMKNPFPWGEDFGLFTAKYNGAMFGLGAGESTSSLHNPDYDFPDDIIPYGVKMFVQIINKTLNK